MDDSTAHATDEAGRHGLTLPGRAGRAIGGTSPVRIAVLRPRHTAIRGVS
jgi:hypothetical protein